MQFEGEHLLPGQIGHFFVLLGFVAALISTIAYFIASRKTDLVEKQSWLRFARFAFFTQVAATVIIFGTIFYICANHYFEYMYAYKHASTELESKYLLACIWEGQEGSFLLWTIWNGILGTIVVIKSRNPNNSVWEAPVMSVIGLAQCFLLVMIVGVYIFNIRIGSSPFTLTRNEIEGPIFSMPNYLSFIKDGVGLNVLLRNYWMVIHPPVLFLGFASTIIPFAYAYAGLQTKRFGEWIQPALPWTLLSALVLGVGIMMGGKWAYESLSFGGYWAWDPVENASLVPWLVLVAGLHTMVIYKATGHSLRANYVFSILTFVFVLYATFLTRTGILADTSVHAFTLDETTKKVTYSMLLLFLGAFTLPSLILFFKNYSSIPTIHKEERTDSREFWMFIGALVLFLASMFIIAKTSVPVYAAITGSSIAPPQQIEISYNKVLLPVTIIIGLLSAITQYFKYKSSPRFYVIKKIAVPTLLAAIITLGIAVYYPITYYKQGAGYLGAIYFALFAMIYSVLANAGYIWTGLKGKLKSAGGSVAHVGFALMLAGILISSSNKKVISNSSVNGINLQVGKDPMTREQDDPIENLTLIRQVPTRMGPYEVTYIRDSTGHEKGRRFYELTFVKKDEATKKITEQFTLWPDVYLMKDNNMSSNPDTKIYATHDIFTYVSYAISEDKTTDTSQFKIQEMGMGDTAFYSNGYLILDTVLSNPNNEKYHFTAADKALVANITLHSKDSMHYKAMPAVVVDQFGVNHIDDTVYAQNMYFRFAGVTDGKKIKLGIKESDKIIDFVTLKAYVFPYINIVWLGLIVMALGLLMSAIKRAKLSTIYALLAFVAVAAGLFYMFLFANT